jgi:hypothetical protein
MLKARTLRVKTEKRKRVLKARALMEKTESRTNKNVKSSNIDSKNRKKKGKEC